MACYSFFNRSSQQSWSIMKNKHIFSPLFQLLKAFSFSLFSNILSASGLTYTTLSVQKKAINCTHHFNSIHKININRINIALNPIIIYELLSRRSYNLPIFIYLFSTYFYQFEYRDETLLLSGTIIQRNI